MYSSFKSVRWCDSSAERWLPGKVESRQDVLAPRCTHSGQRIVGSAYYTLCHKEVHRQHTLSPRVARVRCCPREQMICSRHLSPDASVQNNIAQLANAKRVYGTPASRFSICQTRVQTYKMYTRPRNEMATSITSATRVLATDASPALLAGPKCRCKLISRSIGHR